MIAVVGEALIDLIPQPNGDLRPVLGGSPYNVARALARLEVPVTYLSPLSTDPAGERLLTALVADGGRVGGIRSALPTSLALVALDDAGSASYSLYRQGVADRDVTEDTLIASLDAQVTWLHLGSLALLPPDVTWAEAMIRAARERGVRTAIDVNARPGAIDDLVSWRRGVHRLLPLCDVIKMSVEDRDVLWPEDGDAAVDALAVACPAALVVVTDGERGARGIGAWGEVCVRPASSLPVRDTIGAGDCFQAGLLAWLEQEGRSPADLGPGPASAALRWAGACAGLCVTRVGCDPPRRDEVVAYCGHSTKPSAS